jgi:hypothetical protein
MAAVSAAVDARIARFMPMLGDLGKDQIEIIMRSVCVHRKAPRPQDSTAVCETARGNFEFWEAVRRGLTCPATFLVQNYLGNRASPPSPMEFAFAIGLPLITFFS